VLIRRILTRQEVLPRIASLSQSLRARHPYGSDLLVGVVLSLTSAAKARGAHRGPRTARLRLKRSCRRGDPSGDIAEADGGLLAVAAAVPSHVEPLVPGAPSCSFRSSERGSRDPARWLDRRHCRQSAGSPSRALERFPCRSGDSVRGLFRFDLCACLERASSGARVWRIAGRRVIGRAWVSCRCETPGFWGCLGPPRDAHQSGGRGLTRWQGDCRSKHGGDACLDAVEACCRESYVQALPHSCDRGSFCSANMVGCSLR
jgi:hypothetical protein